MFIRGKEKSSRKRGECPAKSLFKHLGKLAYYLYHAMEEQFSSSGTAKNSLLHESEEIFDSSKRNGPATNAREGFIEDLVLTSKTFFSATFPRHIKSWIDFGEPFFCAIREDSPFPFGISINNLERTLGWEILT